MKNVIKDMREIIWECRFMYVGTGIGCILVSVLKLFMAGEYTIALLLYDLLVSIVIILIPYGWGIKKNN